ncbi:hypothetical protein A2130_01820 [Candidatus Woesebacteria bacterium GWC2_33_12]|nr:MAG: hypothetical protein A2130_01820 [Candidatus Woesebacteria bacterium GWC2_33_12]OGM79466.1 MAG: hypothetical protein A2366_03275 [Candidatus Woesebacteria bacterium RIFOXYB1_FULL_33_9]OGM86357.1 MAG: hypothetical protein A2616_02120 [Candidatus Woesebacteria bacterium RIFOXYD1_FULL_33_11]HCR35485.1 hypothetical protein [Candidatus Woesebacteria bacterium]
MKNKIILFDIDRTIFDTSGMIELLDSTILKLLNYPELSSFQQVEIDYLKTLTNDRYFVPEDYIKKLCKKFNFRNEEKLQDVFYAPEYAYI